MSQQQAVAGFCWGQNQVGDVTVLRRIKGEQHGTRGVSRAEGRLYEGFNCHTGAPALVVAHPHLALSAAEPWAARVVSTPQGVVLELEAKSAPRVELNAVVSALERVLWALDRVQPDTLSRNAAVLVARRWPTRATWRQAGAAVAGALAAALLLALLGLHGRGAAHGEQGQAGLPAQASADTAAAAQRGAP